MKFSSADVCIYLWTGIFYEGLVERVRMDEDLAKISRRAFSCLTSAERWQEINFREIEEYTQMHEVMRSVYVRDVVSKDHRIYTGYNWE